MLALCVGLIYTADHFLDGWKHKGKSGIYRYDFHYKYRRSVAWGMLILSVLLLGLTIRYHSQPFVVNGIWSGLFVVLYFILNHYFRLNPLFRMLSVAVIVSYVVVSLFTGEGFWGNLLGMERLIFTLLVFQNQLVLKHFDAKILSPEMDPEGIRFYARLVKRIFIWVLLFAILSTWLNPIAWPFTLTLTLIATGLFGMTYRPAWFEIGERYRFYADLVFVCMWPLLELLQWF